MSEYEMLRNEMMDNYKIIAQYDSTLYAIVAAVLAIVYKQQSFVLCLIPYIAIIPLYLASEAKRQSICKIAAYLFVFHEGQDKEYNWETRHQCFDYGTKRNWKNVFQYYFLSAICSAAAIYMCLQSTYSITAKWLISTAVVVLTLGIIIFMIFNTVNYPKLRAEYINKWRVLSIEREENQGNHESFKTTTTDI